MILKKSYRLFAKIRIFQRVCFSSAFYFVRDTKFNEKYKILQYDFYKVFISIEFLLNLWVLEINIFCQISLLGISNDFFVKIILSYSDSSWLRNALILFKIISWKIHTCDEFDIANYTVTCGFEFSTFGGKTFVLFYQRKEWKEEASGRLWSRLRIAIYPRIWYLSKESFVVVVDDALEF